MTIKQNLAAIKSNHGYSAERDFISLSCFYDPQRGRTHTLAIAAFAFYFYLSSYLPLFIDPILEPFRLFDLSGLGVGGGGSGQGELGKGKGRQSEQISIVYFKCCAQSIEIVNNMELKDLVCFCLLTVLSYEVPKVE